MPEPTSPRPAERNADDGAPRPAIAIEELRVKADRIVAIVRVGDARRGDTTPAIARAAIAALPDLPDHTCVNGVGPTLGAVIGHTPLPHLLEHVVVQFQVEACPDPDRIFTGATRWTDRRAGLAQVEVSYADDIVALRAFRDGAALVNSLVRTCDSE